MSFVVCCPTSQGGSSHMTFSSPFESKEKAEGFRNLLRSFQDTNVNSKGTWGKNSTLYDLKHPLYQNSRPPHVANTFADKLMIFTSQAYVHRINK